MTLGSHSLAFSYVTVNALKVPNGTCRLQMARIGTRYRNPHSTNYLTHVDANIIATRPQKLAWHDFARRSVLRCLAALLALAAHPATPSAASRLDHLRLLPLESVELLAELSTMLLTYPVGLESLLNELRQLRLRPNIGLEGSMRRLGCAAESSCNLLGVETLH